MEFERDIQVAAEILAGLFALAVLDVEDWIEPGILRVGIEERTGDIVLPDTHYRTCTPCAVH